MLWKPWAEKTQHGRLKKNTEKAKDLFWIRTNPLGTTASWWEGIHCSVLNGSLSPSRAVLFLNWGYDSTFLPSHLPHCCLVLCPSLGCPHLTQLPLITWAHLKLLKFTATWCNPAFVSPLNPFRQLMPESALVPFTQSHSNEQNLNRGRLN